LFKAARLTASTTAKAVRVAAHHQRNERLNNRPEHHGDRHTKAAKAQDEPQEVVVEPRHDSIQTAPTSNISPFYRHLLN